MVRPRTLPYRVTIILCFSLFTTVTAAVEPVYFAQIGAGEFAGSQFRTQFRILNDGSGALTGSLTFYASSGDGLEPELQVQWNPFEGSIEQTSNRVDFEIPAAGSLRLTLVPGKEPQVGYALLETQQACDAQAFFQVSRPNPGAQLFEEGLIREVEILPAPATTSGSTILSLVNGLRRLNTGVALINLSSAPADITLVRRPDEAFPLRLEPGRVFTGFFDELIPLIEIQIFPLETEALVEVVSPVPLAMAAVRTLDGFPLSGVRVAAGRNQTQPQAGQLGQEVVLPISRTVRFEQADLELTFWNILEDSRCPTGAVCVWQGRVRTVVRARLDGGDTEELTLTLLGDTQDSNLARIGEYEVELREVDPHPDLNSAPIEASQYRMTLLVTSSDQ